MNEAIKILKVAKALVSGIGGLGGEASDILGGIVLMNRDKTVRLIMQMVKRDRFLREEIKELGISNPELFKYIFDELKVARRMRPLPKEYYIQENIGRSKYVVNFFDGSKIHKDGSNFYDMKVFANREKMNRFIGDLERDGYEER